MSISARMPITAKSAVGPYTHAVRHGEFVAVN
jgi:hypothetical protein